MTDPNLHLIHSKYIKIKKGHVFSNPMYLSRGVYAVPVSANKDTLGRQQRRRRRRHERDDTEPLTLE
jgi:hypothetical protein